MPAMQEEEKSDAQMSAITESYDLRHLAPPIFTRSFHPRMRIWLDIKSPISDPDSRPQIYWWI
jgi:hypothetical protein